MAQMERSASTDTTATGGLRPRRLPNCARCSNHGLTIRVSGHKRYCKYGWCRCTKCTLTTARQRVMARHTASKRAQILDKTRVKVLGEVDPPAAPSIDGDVELLASLTPQSARSHEGSYDSSCGDSPVSSHGENGAHSGIASVVGISTKRKVSPLHPHSNNNPSSHLPQSQIVSGDSVEILLEYSMKLLQLFQYPFKSVSLMYTILKALGGNFEEAVKRIVEANNDIRMLHFWKALSLMQYESGYYCTGYSPPTDTLGAPTYEGQVPFIGMAPPPNVIQLSPHFFNGHPMPKVLSSPASPSEHSTT